VTDASTGFVHAAGFYKGDEGLLPLVVPFVSAGLVADEPVVIALGDAHAEIVRAALPPSADVTYLADGYARPAGIVAALLDVLHTHSESSPGRMRIVGELAPQSLEPGSWGPWARYEAAVNHLYAPYSATAMCAYDTVTTPAAVLADIAATHPSLANGDGAQHSSHFQDPVTFLGGLSVPPDPAEAASPTVEVMDPDPVSAREAVRAVAAGCAVDPDAVEDLVVGVSEIVTNAMLYGRAPVILRVWAAGDRLVATVSDRGRGPAFPYAGLVPLDGGVGGRGLWITHQICGQVDHLADGDGFGVRLATSPPAG
jgi:anti-sigma regulatory factor (Ser/Thr protein kinase)